MHLKGTERTLTCLGALTKNMVSPVVLRGRRNTPLRSRGLEILLEVVFLQEGRTFVRNDFNHGEDGMKVWRGETLLGRTFQVVGRISKILAAGEDQLLEKVIGIN